MRAAKMGVVLAGIVIALSAIAFVVWVYMTNNIGQPKYRVFVADRHFCNTSVERGPRVG